MPKIACFHLPGLEVWFNSADHEPPHFHLRKPGQCELRVYFLEATMFRLKWGKTLSTRQLRAIEKVVTEHRAALLAEWSAKVHPRTK